MTAIMIPTNWRPLQSGDTVFWPVTDHPNFEREVNEDEPYLFRDRATVEKICLAWNDYDNEGWMWYVRESILLPAKPEGLPDLQMTLF